MFLSEYLDFMENYNEEIRVRQNESLNTPMWLVDTNIGGGARAIHKDDFKRFKFYDDILHNFTHGNSGLNNYQFMIGPARTGASPHIHNSAINLLVFGRKIWFIFQPQDSFYSNKPVYDWLLNDLQTLLANGVVPALCTQQPGDILFVPNLWGHAVIATKDSVNMAHLYYD
jgi:hypothetical protein